MVDDDDDIREVVRAVLEDAGYAVDLASNGAEALLRLGELPTPALVLLDLMMPTMGGGTFLHEWARRAELPRAPVLILTASTPAFVATLGLLHPTLHKPLELNVFLEAVTKLAGPAEGRRPAPEAT